MENPKDVKISKMVIQLTDEQISLSMNDAKKLFEALQELFGKKIVEHHYHDNFWSYKPYWYGKRYLEDIPFVADKSTATEYKSNMGMFKASGEVLMCDLSK